MYIYFNFLGKIFEASLVRLDNILIGIAGEVREMEYLTYKPDLGADR